MTLIRGGDTPHVLHGVAKDYKRLYYSDHLAALRVDVTLQAGYGLVEQGSALAMNISAAGNIGKLVPYNPTSWDFSSLHPGRAFLVANTGTTDKFVYVAMEDSYKFAIGDDVILNDNTTSAENKGAITAIDRTSEVHRAKITFTAAIGGTAFLTTRYAYLAVEAGDNTNNYSDCVGILEKSVDTGAGQYAKGANATLIIGNAVLYEGLLTNVDSAAKTDLSAGSFGQYLYMR